MIIKCKCNIILSRSLASFPIYTSSSAFSFETKHRRSMFRRRQRGRQKSNFALALHFFVHFFAVNARLRRSEINFTIYGGRKDRRRRTFCLSFLFLNSYGIKKRKFRITRSHFLNNFFPAIKSWHANRISFKKYIYSDTCLPLWYNESIGTKILKEFYKNVQWLHILHNKHISKTERKGDKHFFNKLTIKVYSQTA